MKRISFIICLSLIFISCDESFEESLIGTWNLHTAEFTECSNPSSNEVSPPADASGCIDTYCEKFTLREDGTFAYDTQVDSGMELTEGIYTVSSSNVVTICFDVDCFTLDLNGDVFSLTIEVVSCTLIRTYKKQ